MSELAKEDVGVTEEDVAEALKILDFTEDEMANMFAVGYRSVIREADVWQPLARQVAGIVALALKKDRALREGASRELNP